MGLKDHVTAKPGTKPGARIDTILAELPKADAKDLRELLTDPGVGHSTVHRAMKIEFPHITCSASAVQLWRRHNLPEVFG